MNRLKFQRILLCLFIVLTVIFLIGIIVDGRSNNLLGRIGLWCGFISQFLLAVTMFLEIQGKRKSRISRHGACRDIPASSSFDATGFREAVTVLSRQRFRRFCPKSCHHRTKYRLSDPVASKVRPRRASLVS